MGLIKSNAYSLSEESQVTVIFHLNSIIIKGKKKKLVDEFISSP